MPCGAHIALREVFEYEPRWGRWSQFSAMQNFLIASYIVGKSTTTQTVATGRKQLKFGMSLLVYYRNVFAFEVSPNTDLFFALKI